MAGFDRKDKGEDSPQRIVRECYCMHGHSLISDLVIFGEHHGITVRLRGKEQEGMLSLSPVIGDKSRTFFDFERVEGEVIDICCPTCSEPLPIYNACTCGAYLVTLFTSPRAEFSDAIGICQRIGCLHSEIKSNRDLRLYSRTGHF